MVSRGSILGGFRLLAWLFPAPPMEEVTGASLEELKAQYKSRDRWGNWLGFFVFIVLAVVLFFFLDIGSDWYYREHLDAVYFIQPMGILWGCMAAFLSLGASMLVSLMVIRLNLGANEYVRYMTYVSHRTHPPAPYDVTKVAHLFFWLAFVPLFAGTILHVDNYTAFNNDGIIDNPFWSLGREKEHPYSTVRGVYEILGRHARFRDEYAPRLVIIFSDGDRWESEHRIVGGELEYQRAAAGFVAEKIGQDVQYVDFPEDIPQ